MEIKWDNFAFGSNAFPGNYYLFVQQKQISNNHHIYTRLPRKEILWHTSTAWHPTV